MSLKEDFIEMAQKKKEEELIKHKNESIAKMIWTFEPSQYGYYLWVKPRVKDQPDIKITSLKPLLFNSDVNWMFEAIEFIESEGYHVDIIGNTCSITLQGVPYGEVIFENRLTKKEAIFEAIYKFSQLEKDANKEKIDSKKDSSESTTGIQSPSEIAPPLAQRIKRYIREIS